ncbi:hypothetical protein Tco_1203428 [Tanacetum coccineum]
MRTRNSNFLNNSNVTILRRRNKGRAPNIVEPELRTIVEVAPMAERTMEELLRAPTEGYGEAIVLPEINADHFEIKTNLLQLVQANPFHGLENENPHAHINSFKRITSTLRFRNVPNDVIKLMMFPYSLEGAAKTWMNTTSRESVSKTDKRIDKLADQLSTLVEIVSTKVAYTPPVKAVEEKLALLVEESLLIRTVERELIGDAPQKASRKAWRSWQVSYSMQFSGNGFYEEYAPELLGFSNNDSLGGNHMPTRYFLNRKIVNNDPFQLPLIDLKQSKVTKAKPSIEEPPKLELKDLPSHLEYAYLEENDKLRVIISKGLKDDEKEALLKVLKSHKWAIAWKITDIKGIDPRFCIRKILMEDDYKPTAQRQRRVNLKIHEVIKKEVLKLLNAGMIYPISDSPWVSPVHCVPKKGGITVVANEENELILTRYFQIPIDPQDQEKTTFTCPYGAFAHRRMPFSLCNAPEWEIYSEEQRKYWKIIRVGNHTEVYQTFEEMLKRFDREGLDRLWSLVKKTFSTTDPTEDKEKELWVEIKRLYEPDPRDQLWALQRYMHDPLDWRLYDTCGVHHVSTERGHEIFMLVEKDYPLIKGLTTLLLCNKLQVDQAPCAIKGVLRSKFRNNIYENTRIYKERTKKWHDSRLRGDKDFKVGDKVLLYNSHMKMYPGKLKSKWSGPNIVKTVYPHGAIEITDKDGVSFKVNGQRLKKYYGGNIDKEDDEVIEFENGVT